MSLECLELLLSLSGSIVCLFVPYSLSYFLVPHSVSVLCFYSCLPLFFFSISLSYSLPFALIRCLSLSLFSPLLFFFCLASYFTSCLTSCLFLPFFLLHTLSFLTSHCLRPTFRLFTLLPSICPPLCPLYHAFSCTVSSSCSSLCLLSRPLSLLQSPFITFFLQPLTPCFTSLSSIFLFSLALSSPIPHLLARCLRLSLSQRPSPTDSVPCPKTLASC